MKPAIFTTDEPPAPIDDMLVKEYINELRRRIEVMNIQMEALVNELYEAKNEPRTTAHGT